MAATLLAATPAAAEDAAGDAARRVPPDLACAAAETPAVVTELYFGRDAGGRRVVGEARWTRFLAREITPRFPDGLTVVDAYGQWRDPARGRIVREATKVVVVVTPAAAETAAPEAGRPSRAERIAAVVAAYKRSFGQSAVLTVRRAACATF